MPSLTKKSAAPVKKAVAKRPAAPRPPVDDDEETEAAPPRAAKKAAPSKFKRPTKGPAKDAVQEGWDGAENQKSDPNFPTSPTVKPGETFYFKFIDDKPYAAMRVHWIERKGKRSFACPQTDDCPLCMLGDNAKFDARFNIAMLGEEMPMLRTLNVGQQASDEFKGFHSDKRTGPLSSKFYSRTRPSGAGGRWKTEVFKRDGDLTDEIEALGLNIYVPTTEEIAELGRWTKDDAMKDISMSELQQIADEIAGDYDDDD